MKTKAALSFVHIKEAELRQLTTQVKEEIATGVNLSKTPQKKKKFGTVDLWNCRRMSRSSGLIIR